MSAPLVSVCIPAYKRTDYLKRLLNSIKEQSFTNYEIILSDDSPDDSVWELVQSFNDRQIHYTRNNPAAGTPANWNRAIQKAKGKWIKLMHDDDWFASSDALKEFMEEAESNKYSFIFSASRYVHENGNTNIGSPGTEERKAMDEDHLYLLYDNIIGHPSTILHKKDEALMYNTAYKWLVDIDFYLRYLDKHRQFFYIPDPLVNIGTGSTQVSVDCYKNPY